jgi:ATP-binding cassette, subfamily B, bacterial
MTAATRYRAILRYAWRQWPRLLTLIALNAITAWIAVLQPWPLKLLVDYALGRGNDDKLPGWIEALVAGISPQGLVIAAAAGTFALFVVNAVLSAGVTWTTTVFGSRMSLDVAADLFRRLQRLSLLFHNRRSVGDALTRLTGDAQAVNTVTHLLLLGPLQHIFTIASVGVVAWQLDAELAVLSLVILPVLATSTRFFGRALKRRAQRSREAQGKLFSFVQRTLTALPMVQSFTAEDRNTQQFDQIMAMETARARRENVVQSGFQSFNGFITTAATATILFAGGRKVLAGALSVGSLLVFLAYLRMAQGSFKGLLQSYAGLKSAEPSIERVFEVLDAEERVPEAPGALPLPPARVGGGAAVRLEGIVFGYEPGRAVLRDLTLEAAPGEMVALVGQTGAGKSTLVSLVPRFFDPWAGRVTIDGVDVRGVQLRSLRERVALVLQDAFVLPLTVAENIAYGRPEATRAEVEAAARVANAQGFIERLPAGYDTVLGERGATLSGGERQRLAIARAVLKDAPILILDEPTSALDAETETLVFGALERLMQGRTTLVIAHRLSTVRRADRIVVLHDGQIAEMGTPAELSVSEGAYARLNASQLGNLATAGV